MLLFCATIIDVHNNWENQIVKVVKLEVGGSSHLLKSTSLQQEEFRNTLLKVCTFPQLTPF